MLKIVKTMEQLPVSQLMEICRETLQADAQSRYDDLPPGIALEYAELDMKEYLEQVFFREQGAYYALWYQNGCYVSALRMLPHRDGLLLHSLNTRPDCRRCGYAGALIDAVGELEQGKRIYSHVKTTNLPSLKLHHKLGFSQILPFAVYLDGTKDENAVTFCRV